MWCRAFIATIALTYIICVLILNGVQKEDLDVNTLKKLQRHNVNIEDMNNEELRKECMKVTGHSRSEKERTTMHSPESSGEQKANPNDSNLQNLLLNYFSNRQKENDSAKPRTETPNIHYFMNLLNKINKTAQHIAVETTTNFMSLNKRREDKNMDYINKILEKFVAFQKLTTTNRPSTTQIDYDDFAQKVEELLNKKRTQTTKKPFTEERNDLMKSVMDNLDVSPLKIFGPAIKTAVKKENKQEREQNLLSQFKILYSDNEDSFKITTTTGKTKIIETTTRNQNSFLTADIIRRISDSVKAKVLQDLQASMRITAVPKMPLQNNDKETQPLTADVIKEISDSVKARVLKDLQDSMSTSVKPLTVTTTDKPKTVSTTEKLIEKRKTITTTTVTTTENPEEQKIKDSTKNKPVVKTSENNTGNVLLELMKMFQEFKTIQNNSAQHATQINTPSFGQIRIDSVGSESPWAQMHPLTITPIIIHPAVIPIGAADVQSALETPVMQAAHNSRQQNMSPNSPFSLLSLAGPDKDRTITQFNIFNHKENNHKLPASLIQTNSAEVHPIGLPAEHSYVYQNIIVSTNRPLQRVRQDTPRNSNFYLPPHINNQNQNQNGNNNKNPPRYYKTEHQNREHYKDFGPVRNEMRTGDYYKPQYYEQVTRRTPVRHGNYVHHAYYNDRKKERFHEKLEKSDNYGRPHMIRYREHGKDLEFSTAKIASRLQMPMYREPKKYDAHFNNFMKTQQKVNDMLERILATKTVYDGEETKSVETV